MNKVSSTTAEVVGRIARLPEMPMTEIRELWRKIFDVPVPTHNRQYLERRIAYRLQELDLAQREPEILQRNRERIDALVDQIHPKKQGERGPRVRVAPGTILVREFAGVEHRVVAMPDGRFEYQGKPYSSLTAISNLISGTLWSGPKFFGLRPKPPAKKVRK